MLWFLFSCAVKVAPLPDPLIEIEPFRQNVDWEEVESEATVLLQEYLRVDTINPPGNELQGALFLEKVLEKEGIETEIHESEPGRGNLVARIPAAPELKSDEKALCLLSHIDVVTHNEENWPQDKHPMSGTLDDDGIIWGRGALDMKGMGIMELMTMLLIKRMNIPLHRDVIMIAVADEEVGGTGMQFMVNTYWDFLNCGQMINEGGLGLKDMMFEGQSVYPISVGEKGNVWLKMWAYGEAGHGSTPRPNEAPQKLLEAILKLQNRPIEAELYDELQQLFVLVGDNKGGVYRNIMANPMLFNLLVKPKLMENPLTRAALINTVHLTGFAGENMPNVVPAEVYAVLDCRILPGVDPQEFIEDLQGLVGPEIHFEVLHARAGNASPIDDPLYSALARYAVEDEPNSVAGPVISVGFTDSIYARPLGTHAYGFVPILVTENEMEGFHGKNERISKEQLGRGVYKLYSAVVEVSAVQQNDEESNK
ncbi:MAG: hypothetical protein CMK59_05370 [Proteobacteria bacterium]|nr:hypothetical protein [Pseudomonadota bacterium]